MTGTAQGIAGVVLRLLLISAPQTPPANTMIRNAKIADCATARIWPERERILFIPSCVIFRLNLTKKPTILPLLLWVAITRRTYLSSGPN